MVAWQFDGLAGPVVFHDGSETLLDTLDQLISEWPRRRVAVGADAALIDVFRRGGHYVIKAPWLAQPVIEASGTRAAGNLAVDLIEGYLAANAGQLCLHCGAAAFDDRLVLFPGASRAGKSTLMARLCAAGVPVLTDDVLPTSGPDDKLGWSFGLAPRLRLPLPAGCSRAFADFVHRHAGPGDEHAAYLLASAEVRPRFGQRLPIGAVVLLERAGDPVRASLTQVSTGDGLQHLIFQNLAPELAVPDLVARLHRLIGSVPCYRLRYCDLDEAAMLLCARFPQACDASPASGAAAPEIAAVCPNAPTDFDVSCRWQRQADVQLHDTGDGLFIVRLGSNGVHRLNPLAAGIWNLLETPCSAGEAIEVVRQAFPEQPFERLRDDVLALFAAFEAVELIVPTA